MKETLYARIKKALKKALREEKVLGEKMNLIEGEHYKLYLIERDKRREVYQMNLLYRPSWNINWSHVERVVKRIVNSELPENMTCQTKLDLFAGVNRLEIYIYKSR